MSTPTYPLIHWQENGAEFQARWYSEAGLDAPRQVVIADDTMKADVAYRLASQGVGLLWRGDYQNARHLLQALARRADRKPREGAHQNRADVSPCPNQGYTLGRAGA
mgnify:CR=1 FL=1